MQAPVISIELWAYNLMCEDYNKNAINGKKYNKYKDKKWEFCIKIYLTLLNLMSIEIIIWLVINNIVKKKRGEKFIIIRDASCKP